MTTSSTARERPRLPRILQPFQRHTSSGDFVPIIDGLRFYAITAVLIYHIQYNLTADGLHPDVSPLLAGISSVMSLGAFGVHLFFVISGFILALPFAKLYLDNGRQVRLSAYYKRRLTRLEPPYVLALLVMFVVRAYGLAEEGLLPHLGASSVYLHNLIFQEHSLVSAVTWSLEVEVQFYIVAPLLGNLFRIESPTRRRAVILAAMVASAVVAPYTYTPGAEWLLPFLGYFLAGFLLADLYLTERKDGHIPARGFAWDVAATGLWVVIGLLLKTQGHEFAILAVFVFALYYSIMHSRIWYRVTTNPWLFTIGGMCYTIYLYHNFLIRALFAKTSFVPTLVDALGPNLGFLVIVIVTFAFVVVLSGGLFVAVERPCMLPDWPARLRKKLLG